MRHLRTEPALRSRSKAAVLAAMRALSTARVKLLWTSGAPIRSRETLYALADEGRQQIPREAQLRHMASILRQIAATLSGCADELEQCARGRVEGERQRRGPDSSSRL